MRLNLTQDMEFDSNTNWFNKNSMNMIEGLKGKINRAILCKQALDERNTAYGNERNNLTVAAGYAMSLSNDYQNVYSLITQFDSIYISAINQVTDLLVEDIGEEKNTALIFYKVYKPIAQSCGVVLYINYIAY